MDNQLMKLKNKTNINKNMTVGYDDYHLVVMDSNNKNLLFFDKETLESLISYSKDIDSDLKGMDDDN